jgi:hypothetical protein
VGVEVENGVAGLLDVDRAVEGDGLSCVALRLEWSCWSVLWNKLEL